LELARQKVNSFILVVALGVVIIVIPKGHGALNQLQLTLVALLGSDIDVAVWNAQVTSWDLAHSRLVIHDDIWFLTLAVQHASLFDHCITEKLMLLLNPFDRFRAQDHLFLILLYY